MAERVRLKGITKEAFVAEGDRLALNALEKVPLLPKVLELFFKYGIDRWLYCRNMSMAIRVGPNQYPSLHKMLIEACEVLDMPEPELYVSNNPFTNAFAGGVERPYIVLRSSIIDAMDDEQLMSVIGHELGHIKADHILLRSVAITLLPFIHQLGAQMFGVQVATFALQIAFYEWVRQSEFTADRAGLLVSQDLKTSIMAEMVLAGGPNRYAEEMNLDAFMDQARAYQDAEPLDQIGKVIVWLMESRFYSHPMPVARAQAMERWVQSGEFEKILRGEYKGAPTSKAS